MAEMAMPGSAGLPDEATQPERSYKLAGNVHEAEDLVQETFLKARRSFGGFELRDYGAKPWLLKILHNAFLTRRGAAGRGPTLLDDLRLNDIAADLEAPAGVEYAAGPMNWDSFDEELKHAVEELAPEYRMVLLLWALGDLSYKEIAAVLDIPLGTVMSRLFRARRQLGASLAEYAAERGIRPVDS
jgi:RNA polymerase sigma-70 factor (ECF subfamily)